MEITSIDLSAFVQLAPVVLFSVIAFWKNNAFMFMFSCVLAIMSGYYAPDIISGQYETTPLGITVGLCLILYGFVCAAWSMASMFGEKRGA